MRIHSWIIDAGRIPDVAPVSRTPRSFKIFASRKIAKKYYDANHVKKIAIVDRGVEQKSQVNKLKKK